jgi:hypothetical protein
MERKGIYNDYSSFLDCHLDEAKTAAYLRFSDLGEFRRMNMSYPVLKAFLQLKDLSIDKEGILEEIRFSSGLDEEYPPGVDPAVKYPVEQGPIETKWKRDKRGNNMWNEFMQSIMVIVELVRTLQSWDGIDLAEKQLQQATTVKDFEAATGYTFPTDIYDVTKVPAASLIAEAARGEHQLEMYNRAIQLMKNMRRTCYPEVWNPAYGSA